MLKTLLIGAVWFFPAFLAKYARDPEVFFARDSFVISPEGKLRVKMREHAKSDKWNKKEIILCRPKNPYSKNARSVSEQIILEKRFITCKHYVDFKHKNPSPDGAYGILQFDTKLKPGKYWLGYVNYDDKGKKIMSSLRWNAIQVQKISGHFNVKNLTYMNSAKVWEKKIEDSVHKYIIGKHGHNKKHVVKKRGKKHKA